MANKAEGKWALNAPRIAGMSDWYLLTQFKNFKEGKRGAHLAISPADKWNPWY